VEPITTLAATAVGILVPYLAEAGKAATKKLGEDLYQYVKSYFYKKDNAKEALDDLRSNPENSDFQAALRVQIQKLLDKDEKFAKELSRIIGDVKESGGTVNNIVYGNPQNFNQLRDNRGIITNKNN